MGAVVRRSRSRPGPQLPDGSPLAHAMALLRGRNYAPSRVVAVHVDSVLWLDQQGKPRTTFVTVEHAGTDQERTVLSPALRGFLVP